MMKTVRIALLAACTLAIGCPVEDDPPPENNATTDAGQPDTADPVDMSDEPDAGADDMDSGMAAQLDCLAAWPTQRTIERTATSFTLNLSTVCRDVSVDDLADATARFTVDGEVYEASITATEVVDGALVVMEASLPEGSGTGLSAEVTSVELALGASQTTLGATGPRTHLGDSDLDDLLDETEASTLALENPVFESGSGASTNVMHQGALVSPPGGTTPTPFWPTWEASRSEIVLHSGTFDSGDVNEVGSTAVDAADSVRIAAAPKVDGSADLFVLSTCERANCAGFDIWFMHANLNEAGNVAAFEPFLHSKLGTNVPNFAIGIDADVENVPSADGGANALTALWLTTDSALNTNHLVYASAVAPSSMPTADTEVKVTRAPTNAVEGLAEKVVNGKATFGLVRNFKSSLDRVADAGLEGWASYAAPGGGTTFSRFALTGPEAFAVFDSVTFPDIVPGTGEMHIIGWGTDGRARVFAGLDKDNFPVAHVGEVLDTSNLGKTASIRLPKEARPDGRVRMRVQSNDSGTAFSFFGSAIGLNTTKEKDEVPLDALLDGAETMTYPSGVIDPTMPFEPIGGTELTYSSSNVTGSFVFAPGGIATVEAVSDSDCCGRTVANSGTTTAEIDRITESVSLTFAGGARVPLESPTGYMADTSKRVTMVQGGLDTEGVTVVVPHRDAMGGAALVMHQTNADGSMVGTPAVVEVADAPETAELTTLLVLSEAGAAFATTSGDIIVGTPTGSELGKFDNNGTIATGLTDQSGTFQLGVTGPTCPIASPSCAVGAAGDPTLNQEWSRQIEYGGASVSRESVAIEPAAAAIPAIMRIGARDVPGCQLQTLLHVGGATGVAFELPDATMEDCTDLPIPVAAGDIMGTGGEQFLVATSTASGAALTLYWIETSESETYVASLAMGEVPADIDVSSSNAASGVALADVNGDGYPDLYINSKTTALTSGAGPFFLNDGAGGWLNGGESSVPGLDVVGVFGSTDRPGGVYQSVNGNGLGTRKSVLNSSPTQLDLL